MKKSDIPEELMTRLRSKLRRKGECLLGPRRLLFRGATWSTLVVLLADRDGSTPESGTVYRMICGTPGCRNPDHCRWWVPDAVSESDGLELCLSQSQYERYLEMRKKAEARSRTRLRTQVYSLLLSDSGALDGFEHREGMVL